MALKFRYLTGGKFIRQCIRSLFLQNWLRSTCLFLRLPSKVSVYSVRQLWRLQVILETGKLFQIYINTLFSLKPETLEMMLVLKADLIRKEQLKQNSDIFEAWFDIHFSTIVNTIIYYACSIIFVHFLRLWLFHNKYVWSLFWICEKKISWDLMRSHEIKIEMRLDFKNEMRLRFLAVRFLRWDFPKSQSHPPLKYGICLKKFAAESELLGQPSKFDINEFKKSYY